METNPYKLSRKELILARSRCSAVLANRVNEVGIHDYKNDPDWIIAKSEYDLLTDILNSMLLR